MDRKKVDKQCCTFCGEQKNTYVKILSSKEMSIVCGKCGARGPVGNTYRAAIELWKSRSACDWCGGKANFLSAIGQVVFWGVATGVTLGIIYIWA